MKSEQDPEITACEIRKRNRMQYYMIDHKIVGTTIMLNEVEHNLSKYTDL